MLANKNIISKLNKARKIAAWGIIPLAFFAWCLYTIGYVSDIYYWGGLTVNLVVTCLFFLCTGKNWDDNEIVRVQIRNISIIGEVCSVLSLFAVFVEESGIGEVAITIGILSWIVVLAIRIYTCCRGGLGEGIRHTLKKNVLLWFLFAAIVLLAIDNNMFQLKWDGLLYYTAVKSARLSSFSSIALYGHLSQTVGFIYRLFGVLFGNINVGMQIANIVVLLIGTSAFYQSIKVILQGKREYEYILGTSCFAFSPFLLGMVNYYSTDWFCVCLMPVVIYTMVSKKYIEFVPTACIFCFTKEPAVIAFGGLCLGMVINDLCYEKGGVVNKTKRLLIQAKYYYMLIPLLLWLITYRCLGGWRAGNGGFAFDINYIVSKLKLFYLFNFTWIITFGIIIGMFFSVKTKQWSKHSEWLLPLLLSNAALLLFNCAFVTVNHARYIDGFISVNIFICVVLMLLNSKEKTMRSVYGLGIIGGIELLACFVSVDPVSNLLFNCSKLGSACIYSTGDTLLGDSSIYNKQMLWLEHNINEAIGDAIEDNSSIVFIVPENSAYGLVGMSEYIFISDGAQKDILYWDSKKKQRISYAEQEGSNKYDIIIVGDNKELKRDMFTSDIVSVIRTGDQNYDATGFTNCITKEYSYRGWTVYRDVME